MTAFPILLLASLAVNAPAVVRDTVYSGVERQLLVSAPRMEKAEVRIDGRLDDAEWSQAVTLTDFTQVEPAEGAPASERTEVRLFYTATDLYIGIHAFASAPARIRSTLAERDKILRDDHVQILLDTYNDQRRAYALYVNPLGIQQDGVQSEGGGGRRGERVDFSPDFVFDSRGRLTDDGYTVELRIPLKSLKFAAGSTQTWGVNFIRKIAATGAEEAWAPISRGNPSQLAQSGRLVEMHGLRPGRLFEANPTATAKRIGTSGENGFSRGEVEPDIGLNLKMGVTSNITLDATVNPDFSQIEADVGQITVNERFAISVPEKRSFFLEGADIFSTPEPLVYTRTIADPIAGVKLSGKVGAFGVGYLGAVDESPLALPARYAPGGERAIFNIGRLQRDIGASSAVGALVTSRETGSAFNRVAGLDGRVRFGGIYAWQFQGAGSWTRAWAPSEGSRTAAALEERVGHLVNTAVDRTGRRWGFRLQAKDIPQDFRTETGFVRRTGLTDLFAITRFSFFGSPGALVESGTTWLVGNRIYGGRDLWRGDDAREGSGSLRANVALRGNTRLEAAYANRFFVLDPTDYRSYSLPGADGLTRTGQELVRPFHEMRGLHGVSLGASSSYFKTVSPAMKVEWKETPIFAEGTPGEEWIIEGELGARPTGALRVDGSLRHSRIFRERDGSLYSNAFVPRVKAEYQLSRSIFLRAVAQYTVEEVDVLRAPDGRPYLRDELPFRLRRGLRSGEDVPQINPLRTDLLFSYQPSPGTVVFVGYGREVADAQSFRFQSFEPRSDGFFMKLSYRFRS